LKAAATNTYPGYALRELTGKGELIQAAHRNEYVPVLFIEPMNGNASALGYDLESNGPPPRLHRESARHRPARWPQPRSIWPGKRRKKRISRPAPRFTKATGCRQRGGTARTAGRICRRRLSSHNLGRCHLSTIERAGH